jgi:dimethylamine monooxygenase subunit A
MDTPVYFPFASGRYEVSPGLSRFGKDFGNGAADQHVFQIDRDFATYRQTKLASRRECFDRYVCQADLSEDVRAAVATFIAHRLRREHPEHFAGDPQTLSSRLTNEALAFDADLNLVRTDSQVEPPYRDALDALAGQMQEDIAILSTNAVKGHWLSYLHLCFPNHWAVGDKIGRGFAEVHAPVAGIEPINRRADAHVKTMVAAEVGRVRFAWGLGTDDLLNHHPERDAETAARSFDPRHPRAFVRVERQTIWGFPSVRAALFTIRTSFVDCADLKRSNPPMRDALIAAIESMSAASMQYKGLSSWRESLLEWLRV